MQYFDYVLIINHTSNDIIFTRGRINRATVPLLKDKTYQGKIDNEHLWFQTFVAFSFFMPNKI